MRFNWGFFLREAAKNIRLNLLMSVTAATTTFVCILVLGAGLLVSAHVGSVIQAVGQNVQIEAYFPDDIPQQRVDELQQRIEAYPEVTATTYISKEEALERFKETLGDEQIAENLGDNVLPASIQVALENPRDSEVVAEKLRGEGFAEEDLRYPQQTIDRLNRITGYIIWGLRGATALFLVSSVLLISNAIRLSIFARRKEIEVMKLVGASDGFVRTPFLIEGLVQGVVGAALAALVVIWANALFVEWSTEALPFVPISGDAVNAPLLFLILVAVGAIIGVIGSFLSVRRFLKI